MKKALIFVIVIVLVIVAALVFDQGKFFKKEKSMIEEKSNKNIEKGPFREPVVAGAFYPRVEKELEDVVDKFLADAKVSDIGKYVRALIVPHAGYNFSGWVAAYGYKSLIGNPSADGINTVILIGNSHRERFEGASVYPEGYYETPLGSVEIDKTLAKRIISFHENISFHESAHSIEHSLEVQLPFLQRVLPASGWKIVPIVIGNQPGAVDILIDALKGLIDENVLLIASSDLSHYPGYEDAEYSDNKVIEAIITGKKENLRNTVLQLEGENITNLQTCACGQDAIEVVMGLFEDKDTNIKLLKYANSGDVPIGDKSQVVGYASIVFTTEKGDEVVGGEEQKRLLEVARETVETYIKTGEKPDFSNQYPALEKHLGTFVTIKKHDELRGCIGRFQPDIPLYKVVRDMAIAAATEDHRFHPVTKEELGELEYEISVLSPLKKIDSWEDIQIGKHGVQIVKGFRSGVFLPQVATDNNWDLDTFMNVLCTQKAGLAADCWKNDPELDIYVFTAQVFDEKSM